MSEPTGARRYGVGGGDAYYDAVRYGGYEGTREQFGRDQAEFAQNAADVAEAKETVERDAEEVRNTKNTFENTTVPEAIRALELESEDQILAITQKGEEVSQQVETVGTEQKDAVANEGRARVQAVEQAGTTQVGNVNQAGEDQVDAVEQAGADQVQAVTDEGTTQIGAVNRAGSTQVQEVEDKGDKVLNSIPSDYTELVGDVDNLKSAIDDNLIETIYDIDFWSQGHYAEVTGVYTVSRIYICSKKYIEENVIEIACKISSLSLFLLAYDSSDTYVGLWNGTAFAKEYDASYGSASINLKSFSNTYPTYKFIVLCRISSGYISPRDTYDKIAITRFKKSLNNAELDALNKLFMQCAYTSSDTSAYQDFKNAFLKSTDAFVAIKDTYMYFDSGNMAMQSAEGAMITPAYDIGNTTINCTLAGILPYAFEKSSEVGSPSLFVYKDGVKKNYFSEINRWLQPVTGDLAEFRYSIASNNTYMQVTFVLDKNYIDDSYMYVVDSGKVLFAGKNTPYYGLANIDGTVRG